MTTHQQTLSVQLVGLGKESSRNVVVTTKMVLNPSNPSDGHWHSATRSTGKPPSGVTVSNYLGPFPNDSPLSCTELNAGVTQVCVSSNLSSAPPAI